MNTRIYIESQTDRDALVLALSRNGYTVRQGKEKQGNKIVKFVEFWRGSEVPNA